MKLTTDESTSGSFYEPQYKYMHLTTADDKSS